MLDIQIYLFFNVSPPQITECGFMERNYFNIEQSDIDLFYQNFCLQHPKTANNDKCKRISEFLKGEMKIL